MGTAVVIIYTTWKLSVFGVFLVHISSYLDWIRSIFPYSDRMRENTAQKNSKYGHFSGNDNALVQILITEFVLTYTKLVIHQIEATQSICKSIDWLLYDGNLNIKWSNKIHAVVHESIKRTCKSNYSRVLFKFHRIFKRNIGVLRCYSFSNKVV